MSDLSKASLSVPPVKAYDFFSIVFPGASLLICSYYFEGIYAESRQTITQPTIAFHDLPIHWLFQQMWQIPTTAANQVLFVSLVFCVVYLSGQVVTTISNFFLDRLFIYKCYGYPYEHLLLGDPKKDIFVDYFSRRFYRGSIFWLHVTAIFLGFYGALQSFPRFHLLAAYIAIFSFIVWLLGLCLHLIVQWLLRSLSANGVKLTKRLARYLIDCYASIYNGITNPIEKINQTSKPLPDEVTKKYKKFFRTDFKMNPETIESDNYWFTLFYVRTKDPRMSELVHRCHQTSVFARNMAASFYITYAYAMIVLLFKKHEIRPPYNFHICALLVLLFGGAIFFVIRFYYMFVCYYSKCIYRAFVFLHLVKNEGNLAKPIESDSHG